MRPKTLALVLLAVLSFASHLVETLATGRVEMLSPFGLAETLVSIVLLFWWYHLDKAQHDYGAGRLMNAGMLVAAAIALPVYLVRTRGWRRGAIAIGIGAAFLLLTFLLAELAEWLGTRLRG